MVMYSRVQHPTQNIVMLEKIYGSYDSTNSVIDITGFNIPLNIDINISETILPANYLTGSSNTKYNNNPVTTLS